MCDCCDHPLAHAIRSALDMAENAVPPCSYQTVLANLRANLQHWELDQIEKRCYHTGELPRHGDVVWDRQHDRLVIVERWNDDEVLVLLNSQGDEGYVMVGDLELKERGA